MSLNEVSLSPPGRPAASRGSNRVAWVVTALLVVFQIIAFADKAVLGLVATDAMAELRITPVEFGFIGSAFFFLYAIVSFATGALAGRVSVKWILLAMGVAWAVMQFPMLLGGGAAILLATRIVLGGAEGPATAMSLASAHSWFRPQDRALPSSLIATGSALGPVIAAPVLVAVIVAWGWRWAFGVLGIIGLVWVLAWILFGGDGPYAGRRSGAAAEPSNAETAEQPEVTDGLQAQDVQRRVPLKAVVLSAAFLTALVAAFANFWVQGFLTTWFPKYLGTVIGLNPQQVGVATTLPWVFGAALLVALGLFGRRAMRGGASVRGAIALPFAISLIIAGACFALAAVTGGVLALVLLVVGAGSALIYPMAPTAMAYVVAPVQRPLVMAVLAGLASTGAILSPTVVGLLMEQAGYRAAPKGQTDSVEMAANMATGVNNAFLLAGALLLIGGVLAAISFRPDATARRLQGRYAPHTPTATVQ